MNFWKKCREYGILLVLTWFVFVTNDETKVAKLLSKMPWGEAGAAKIVIQRDPSHAVNYFYVFYPGERPVRLEEDE